MLRRTLAAVALLSACGAPPRPIEPTINPEPPVTSAPASPTEAPPTMPAIANRHDATGAANFVVYWVDTFNYAASTGDTTAMREFAPSCEPCLAYASRFELMPSENRPSSDPWTATRIEVVKLADSLEVETSIDVYGETKRYPLTFVVTSDPPYQVRDIYERAPQ